MKSTPTRGVKQYLKPNAYNQLELDWSSIWISLERMRYSCGSTIFALAAFASPAGAGELVLGLGAGDVLDQTGTTAPAVVVEYRADPFHSGPSRSGAAARYSLAVAGQADGDGDIFVGVGLAAVWPIRGGPWFVEAGFMPGYYDHGGGGTSLGGNLQFRTLLGIGYSLSETARISVAIDHKSNADIEDRNPGEETLSLRYARTF